MSSHSVTRSSIALTLRGCFVAVTLAVGASQTFAAQYSWTPKTGSGNWTTTTSWDLNNGTYPNAVGDVAITDGNLTGALTITLGVPITIGTLKFGDRNNSYFSTTFNPGANGSLTFSVPAGNASIQMPGSVNQGSLPYENVINAPLYLDSSVNVSFTTTSGAAQIAVTGSVTTSSAGLKTIRYVPGSSATTSGNSYLSFSNNITDGSGQIGILQNCLAPNSPNSLKLTGTGNTFSGPVQILSRTIEASPSAGTNGALGTGDLQLGNTSGSETATLNLGGSALTVTERNAINVPDGSTGLRTIAVTGAGSRILSGTVNQSATAGLTLSCTAAGNLTLSNTLSGAGPITIDSSGAGKVIFGGSNTYTGAMTITKGAFQLTGYLGSTSSISVAAAGWLGGTGTASGAVTLSGTLSPGATAGTAGLLSLGALTLTSTNKVTAIDLLAAGTRGTAYDGVSILNAGGLTYGGTMSLGFGGSILPDNTTFDIFSFTGSTSGSFAQVASTGYYAGTWTNNLDGTYSLAKDSQTLTFTPSTGDVVVVPEPASITLIGTGIAACVALRLRRKTPGGGVASPR